MKIEHQNADRDFRYIKYATEPDGGDLPVSILTKWFLEGEGLGAVESGIEQYQNEYGVNRVVSSIIKDLSNNQYNLEFYWLFPYESEKFNWGPITNDVFLASIEYDIQNLNFKDFNVYRSVIEGTPTSVDPQYIGSNPPKGNYNVDENKKQFEAFSFDGNGWIPKNRYRCLNIEDYGHNINILTDLFRQYCIDIFGEAYEMSSIFPNVLWDHTNTCHIGLKPDTTLSVYFGGISASTLRGVLQQYNFNYVAEKVKENLEHLVYRRYDVGFNLKKIGNELVVSKVKIYSLV
jgi:hypothetical protein